MLVGAFLDEVFRSGVIPRHGANGTTDAQVLLAADRELLTTMSQLLMAANQDWWIVTKKQAVVSGRRHYRIPRRAVLGRIKSLAWTDGANQRQDLLQVSLEEAHELDQNAQGAPEFFWVRGERVAVWPKPTTGYLEFEFLARPGALTSLTQAQLDDMAIITLTSSAGTWGATYDVASDVIATGNGQRFDIVRASSGWGCVSVDMLGDIASAGTISGTTSADLPEDFADCVGDYIVPALTCPVIPLPDELHPVFVQATVAGLSLALGSANYDRHRAALETLISRSQFAAVPRADTGDLRVRGGIIELLGA